ncbi:hypothetical protein HS125_01520 [bacterium]|nr:hypothetical protein [bacterium]
MGRLVILTGPSCVGKGPLKAALWRFYPHRVATLQPLVLYNSRAPRPGEQNGVDYHFRPRQEIEELEERAHCRVIDARGDLQAVDLSQLARMLSAGDVFYEGNPLVARELLSSEPARAATTISIFVSPLSREEIVYLKDPALRVNLPELVTDVMRRKLLRRTVRQKGLLSQKDLEVIERRAGSAYRELRMACQFQHVLPNHDGEDSENWDAFYYPIGDARKVLCAVAALLAGEPTDAVEHWTPDLLP